MPYNTGNPVGSKSPKDLLDNSENLDHLVNDTTVTERDDRLGVPRKTWHGMETEFDAAQVARQAAFDTDQADREAEWAATLAGAGYVGTGVGGAFEDYDVDGPLTIEAFNEIFTKSGEFYRAKPGTTLPYTTSGTWATDQNDFVAVGDAALRSELAAPGGARKVKDAVSKVATITELGALTGLVDGQQISVAETGYIYKYVSGTDSFEELPGRFKGDDGKLYQVVSAILRQDSAGSGWYVLDDAGHAPIGLDPVTPVTRLGDDIVLNYSFTSNKVGTLVMSTDEGFAISGVDFGASIGNSESVISAFYPFWVRVNGTVSVSHSYFGARGTDWDAVVDIGAGTWTFTHPSESHSDNAGSVIAIEGYGDDSTATTYEVVARSKTGFTVEARQVIHGRTSGASVISDNVGPQSAAWDGVDTLTVTHPQSASANDAVVTPRSPQYNAAITASTDTTISVKFYDIATGALFAGGSRPTEVYYQRGGKAACAITGSTKFKAQRLGKCQLNADNVAGGTSNLQVYGVFELDL